MLSHSYSVLRVPESLIEWLRDTVIHTPRLPRLPPGVEMEDK
jgi:hypothetical protein